MMRCRAPPSLGRRAPIAVAGAAWLLLPRGFPARWLGAVAFLPLFFLTPPRLADGEAKLTVLDVGQGLAVVVQTRDHALLYDTGPAFSPGADSGTRTILPYLRASGIHALDGLIVSHDDIDHSGGATPRAAGPPQPPQTTTVACRPAPNFYLTGRFSRYWVRPVGDVVVAQAATAAATARPSRSFFMTGRSLASNRWL